MDWPGLLKWSLQYCDGTREKSSRSKEDMEFLANVIKEALSKMEDPSKLVEEAAIKLNNENTPASDRIAALSVIERLLDSYPEMNRNLHKHNLVDTLIDSCTNDNDDVSCLALSIISLALPHNPEVQQIFAEKQALEKLMSLWNSSNDVTKKRKTLSAISSLTKHNEITEKAFVAKEGLAIIVDSLRSNDYRYQEKGMSLLSHLFFADRLTFFDVTKFEIPQLIKNLLDIRNTSQGLQHAELCALLTVEFLQKHRPQLAKTGSLEFIRESIQKRIENVNELSKQDEDYYSQLLELLNSAYKISNYPLDRTSSKTK